MRVVIGDDETLVRAGLTQVLEQGGFEVVAAACDAGELVRLVMTLRPDLVVTDIRMPPGNGDDGLTAALAIRRALPEAAIVVLSQHVQRKYAIDLLASGSAGIGYLLKQRIGDVTTFCADLRRVCDGGTALDPEVVALMMARARHGDDAIDGLTDRQLQVLSLMAQGWTNGAIARRFVVTEKTVTAHVSRLYGRLGLLPDVDGHRRVLAVVQYLNRR